MAQTYFASIPPGLERALLDEIRDLGGNRPEVLHGGVEFDAARKRLYLAHLQFRTPTRIWLRVDEFRARDAPELYKKTRRFDWERLLGGEHKIQIRAHSSESRLYHTGKIRDAVADGLRDRFSDELDGETAPEIVDDADDDTLTIMARLADDRCQLNLDASGERLHRRGWRIDPGKAPLRENLAAAILELIDWAPEDGLVDPFCGSATFPIEAACRAVDRAPGLDRPFALEKWRNFQPERFEKMREELRQQIRDEAPAPIIGHDIDSEIVGIARMNAVRAEVADHVALTESPIADLQVPDGVGWIVTNPPYGDRLDESGVLVDLVEQWRELDTDCNLAFIWPADDRPRVNDLAAGDLERRTSFDHGGTRIDLWVGDES